jgi:hypothetical protein
MKFIDSAVVLSVLTGFFLSIGLTYQLGFYNYLDLDPSILESSLYESIYLAMSELLPLINVYMFLIILILIVILYVIGRHIIINLKECEKVISFINKLSYLFIYDKESKKIYKCFVVIIFVLLISNCYFFILVNYYEKGKVYGGELITAFKADHVSKSKPKKMSERIISVKIDGEKKELFLLECGANNCAAIEKKTNKIYYFPQNISFSFVYPEI